MPSDSPGRLARAVPLRGGFLLGRLPPRHVGSVFRGNGRNHSARCSGQNLAPRGQENPALAMPAPHLVPWRAPALPRGWRLHRGSQTRAVDLFTSCACTSPPVFLRA